MPDNGTLVSLRPRKTIVASLLVANDCEMNRDALVENVKDSPSKTAAAIAEYKARVWEARCARRKRFNV